MMLEIELGVQVNVIVSEQRYIEWGKTQAEDREQPTDQVQFRHVTVFHIDRPSTARQESA